MDSLEMIRWMANTVHQAYHSDSDGSWCECSKPLCKSAAKFLNEFKPDSANSAALKAQKAHIARLVRKFKRDCEGSSFYDGRTLIALDEVLDMLKEPELGP